ncbi:hypothetical protein NQ317_016071 [Molorchus minor]|uniref:Kinesin motor domain-containing protein n=1 Tax=Molorchus minor TaxID=1323400 RepID=A0ABQ9IXY3_9CUCU|nr:hypothetical protein NQ317_016071 [Molorchus minor]
MEIHIETAIRVCPVEYNNGEILCVQSNNLNNTVQLSNSQVYPVNYALPINCCQNTLYSTVISPLVNFLLEGCDVSVVTIGQAGTGKTYTLFGPGFHFASSESEYGVIPRFIREVFTKTRQYRDRNFSVHITWSQICGENVQDLLGGGCGGSVECADILDVFQLLQLGMSNVAPKCAHTLFTLTLEQHWTVESTIHHRISTASFADLSGSEKLVMYNNGVIQTLPMDPGLQALQRCIMILSDPCLTNFNISQIPYSQSVLTTLLRDSFGGRAKTVVIVMQAQTEKNHFMESKYKTELEEVEEKLKDAESLKNITEDGSRKLMELQTSLKNSKKQLEKIKKYKKKEEKRKLNYENQIREGIMKLKSSKGSTNSTEKNKSNDDLKTVAILLNPGSTNPHENSTNISLSNEDLECLRHEIRNLRKTRDYLLEQKCKIDDKCHNKKLLNDIEERKLLQYEEAIEAIDLAIEYKNEIICGHRPVSERALERVEEQGDKMLMDRLMKLSETEMRVLLHKYFQKVCLSLNKLIIVA